MRTRTLTWNPTQLGPVSWALLIWSVIGIACCIRAWAQPERNNVYVQYAPAGRAWIEGNDAYGLDSDGDTRVIPSMSAFRYAPVVAVVLAPFSALPLDAGSALWRLLSTLAFLAAFAWYVRDGLPAGSVRSERDTAGLWLLLIPLSLVSVNNGQANVLTMACLLGGATALLRERWNCAAALLAVAFLFKLYPLAVVMLFMLLYPRQLIGRFILAVALGLALPFAYQTPGYVLHAYDNWITLVLSDNRREFLMHEGLRDFYLLTRFVGMPLPPRVYLMVQLLAAGAIALIGLWSRWRALPMQQQVALMLNLGCCWMVVFGPAVESCTYILIGPALAYALVDAWARQRSWWVRGALVVIMTMFISTYVTGWFRESRDWLYLFQPLAAFLFCVERCVSAVWEVRNHPATGAAPTVSEPLRRAA